MSIALLQQVRVLDPVSGSDRVADVLIQDGVIQAVEAVVSSYPDATQVKDCRGLVLGPGLVDLYSHSGEPGFEARETLASLMQAAIAGGFTRLTLLPDTVPAIDNPASVAWLHQRVAELSGGKDAGEPGLPAVGCWAALTDAVQGQQMTELGELAMADIVGFADGQPIQNLSLVRRSLEYLRPLQKPVAFWACDRTLAGSGVMREGQASLRFGLPGIPAIAETVALAALLECVETIGTPVHLMRLSTARGVELVRAAKARGVPVTASTTWMHLLSNCEAVGGYDPHLRLDPPLGNPVDQAALLQGLRDGTLDAIAVDHTPHTYEDKTVAFAEAPPGSIGFELALPLLWQALVGAGAWSALELWECLSTRPAKCLVQTPGAIAPQQPAELTLFDPQQAWTVNERSLKSLSANTPWLGQTITGQVINVWTGKRLS